MSERGVVMCWDDESNKWSEGEGFFQNLTVQLDPQISESAAMAAIVNVGAGVRALAVKTRTHMRDADGYQPTDLVLVEPADATALRSRLTGDSAAPLVLSLVAASTAAADADPEVSSCLLQATVDQSMDVIQTIERFISNRQAGKLISCASAREPGCFLALAGGLRTIPSCRTGSNPT